MKCEHLYKGGNYRIDFGEHRICLTQKELYSLLAGQQLNASITTPYPPEKENACMTQEIVAQVNISLELDKDEDTQDAKE